MKMPSFFILHQRKRQDILGIEKSANCFKGENHEKDYTGK